MEGRTEVEALVADGEGPQVEFKAELPASREARREVARTVAAFANGGGGTVLFGVRDTDGEIVGVAVEGRRAPSVDVSNWVKDLVVPIPEDDARAVEVTSAGERRVVVILTVEPGTTRPYGVDPVKPSFYVRRGSTTFPATQEQIRALALAGSTAAWGVPALGYMSRPWRR